MTDRWTAPSHERLGEMMDAAAAESNCELYNALSELLFRRLGWLQRWGREYEGRADQVRAVLNARPRSIPEKNTRAP